MYLDVKWVGQPDYQKETQHHMHHHYRHNNNHHHPHHDPPHQPGTVAYAAGWGAIIPDDQLGPLAFLIPKAQKRPTVLQVRSGFLIARDLGHKELKSIWLRCLDFGHLISAWVSCYGLFPWVHTVNSMKDLANIEHKS